MKNKIRYTDEPMEVGRIIPNFLPPPDKLVFKEDAVKVTLSLSTRSVHFFKSEAAKHGVRYQRMIRKLLDAYVDAVRDAPKGSAPRVEQARAKYRAPRQRTKAR